MARALLPANPAALLRLIAKHVPEEFGFYEMRKFAFKDLEWWVVTIVGRIEQQFILTTKDTKSCEEKYCIPSRSPCPLACVESSCLLCSVLLHKDLLAG